MIVEEVELKNILSHEHTKVMFKRGVNVIVGPNGAGKSSIIDAILWATLGTCTKSGEVVRSTLGEMLRVGAQSGYVRVVFNIRGRRYEVRREIYVSSGRPSSRVTLSEVSNGNVKPVAVGDESVCRILTSLLGVKDPVVLTSTLISRQGYLAELLELKPSERRERILELAGGEKLEEAREALGDLVKKLGYEIGELRSDASKLRDLEGRVKQLEAEISRLKGEIESLQPRREELRSRIEVLRVEREKLVKARDLCVRIRGLEERLKAIEDEESKVARVRAELEKLPPREKAGKLLESWSVIRDARQRLERYERELGGSESKLKEILAKLENLGYRVEGDIAGFMDKLLDQLDREERELQSRLAAVQSELRILGNLVNVDVESDKCPLCGQPIGRDRLKHILEAHRRRFEELEREKGEVQRALDRISRLKVSVEGWRNEVVRLVDRIQQIKPEVDSIRQSITQFLELCSDVVGSKVTSINNCPVDEIRRGVERRERLEALLEDSMRRLEELRREFNVAELENLKLELGKLGVSCGEVELGYERVERELEGLEKELLDLERRISTLEGQLKAKEEELSKARVDVEKLRSRVSRLPILERIQSVMDRFRDRVLGKSGLIAKMLTRDVRVKLEGSVNSILAMLGKDFRVGITEDFNIVVRRGGLELSLNSLSGGERTLLAIVFRIALALVLVESSPSILVLDEPTEYLDEINRSQVFQEISRIAGNLDQVIVVTHDVEIEGIADRIIRVTKIGDRSYVQVEDVTT